MSELTYSLPEIGVADFTQDPRILTAFTNILTWAAGQIDGTNIKEGGLEGRNCNKEIPKLEAGATYSETTRAANAEWVPSAIRPTVLNFLGKQKLAASSMTVKVNGIAAQVVEAEAGAVELFTLSITGIYVPAGAAVKLEGTFVGNAQVRTLVL